MEAKIKKAQVSKGVRQRLRGTVVGNVPSPCVQICQLEGEYCVGCGRSIDEIRDWIIMTEDQQKQLLTELENRNHERERNQDH